LKPNYIKGGVAILAGILCFIPVFLPYLSIKGYGGGGSYMNGIESLKHGSGFTMFVLIVSLLTMIAALLLIIIGILMFVPQVKLPKKLGCIATIVVGALALLTGLLGMIDIGTTTGLSVGAGSVLYFLFGLLTIAAVVAMKFVLKEETATKKAPAPKAATPPPAATTAK